MTKKLWTINEENVKVPLIVTSGWNTVKCACGEDNCKHWEELPGTTWRSYKGDNITTK